MNYFIASQTVYHTRRQPQFCGPAA